MSGYNNSVNSSLLSPGTLVKIQPGEEFLVLWPSSTTMSYEKEAGRVFSSDVMTILKVKKARKIHKNISDEWQKGSYLVLSSTGVSGWVGEGWVVPVN